MSQVILLSLMMLRYILKRILWFVPVLFCVVLLLFILDQQTTGIQFSMQSESSRDLQVDRSEWQKAQRKIAHDKGWDLPLFYVTLTDRGLPKTYYEEASVLRRNIIENIGRLTLNQNTTETVVALITKIYSDYRYGDIVDDYRSTFLTQYKSGNVNEFLLFIQTTSESEIEHDKLKELRNEMKINALNKKWRWAVPVIKWHGKANRFHKFIQKYFIDSSQKSSVDGRPIYSKVWPAAGITLSMNLFALVLLIVLGIPLGTYLYKHEGKLSGRIIQFVLYALFALPLFWIATVVLIIAGWMPGYLMSGTMSLKTDEIPSILTFLRPENIVYLILPIFTVVVGLLAFLTIQMYRSLREVNEKKFILAAHSRGLSSSHITKIHNKPNAMYSILTIIGNSIPQLISGSVVIEIIFNIPGMGRLLFNGLYDFDWSLVIGILIVGVLFSVIGQLLTDLAYYYFNPQLHSSK